MTQALETAPVAESLGYFSWRAPGSNVVPIRAEEVSASNDLHAETVVGAPVVEPTAEAPTTQTSGSGGDGPLGPEGPTGGETADNNRNRRFGKAALASVVAVAVVATAFFIGRNSDNSGSKKSREAATASDDRETAIDCAPFEAGTAFVYTAEDKVEVAEDAYLAPYSQAVADAKEAKRDAKKGSDEAQAARKAYKVAVRNLKDAKKALKTCDDPQPASKETKECADTWAIVETDNANSRLMANGIPEIGTASTPEEARKALEIWMDKAFADPDIAAGAYKLVLDRDVDPDVLVDKSGKCASELNEKLATEFAVLVSLSKVFADQAPENGTNTGVDANGQVVAAEQAGIDGNRKAVKVVGPDGKTFWVMERCGNLVVVGPPSLPKGPTDQVPLKAPVTLPGPDNQPGSGGSQGRPDEPDCDSDNDGYCDGQSPATGGSGTTETTPPRDDTEVVVGPPRPVAPPTPAITLPDEKAPSGGGKPAVPVN